MSNGFKMTVRNMTLSHLEISLKSIILNKFMKLLPTFIEQH